MLLTAAVTTRPPARFVAVIAPAASISDMIQPPNISPFGLVSAGIARVRAASSPGGCGGSERPASRSVWDDIAQLLVCCRGAPGYGAIWAELWCSAINKLYRIVKHRSFYHALRKTQADDALRSISP